MLLGTTYSHLHSAYLKLPPQAFDQVMDLGFDHIRIGCYWQEIEKEPGVYDFSSVQKLLTAAQKRKQQVIVTIGMKAPRWPEFYFPTWLKEKNPEASETAVLQFIQKAILTLQHFTIITHWQVENEPLDPSGAQSFAIQSHFLQTEVALVRKYDSRPIIISLWGNALQKRKFLPIAVSLADVVGLDIYYKVPFLGSFYKGPKESDQDFAKIIEQCSKKIYITELQAEPWENTGTKNDPKSLNVALLKQNYERAYAMQPEAIFFWGVEYWLWKKYQGDDTLWRAVQHIITKNR